MNRRCFLGIAMLATPAAAEWRRDNKEQCERIDDKLKNIEDQRRVGYTPKQGRRLLAQRDKLEEQRREKCR